MSVDPAGSGCEAITPLYQKLSQPLVVRHMIRRSVTRVRTVWFSRHIGWAAACADERLTALPIAEPTIEPMTNEGRPKATVDVCVYTASVPYHRPYCMGA